MRDIARARCHRRPFTDPREGRLLREIRDAFEARGVEVLTTNDLLTCCYGGPAIRRLAGSKRWFYEMVKRAALKICTPIGRSPRGRGRPTLWRVDREKLERRRPRTSVRQTGVCFVC
jgi:hypothetical protein